MVLHSIWSLTYGNIVIVAKYLRALCTNFDLMVLCEWHLHIVLLIDLRRKGSSKHEVWQIFRVKRGSERDWSCFFKRKRKKVEEAEEGRTSMGKAKFKPAHFYYVQLLGRYTSILCYLLSLIDLRRSYNL